MNTQLLTPQQREQQAKAYEEQARRIREQQFNIEVGPEVQHTSPEAKKSSSFSKNIINWAFIIFGVFGIIGSFWAPFDMIKYVSFLETFAWLWAPLVVAVGGGRAFKNFVQKKYHDQPQNPPANPGV